MTAHQLYIHLKPYGIIEKLSYVIENGNFDLICKQPQTKLKSTGEIQCGTDKVHIKWLRDDTVQGDLCDNNQFDCLYSDNQFILPPSFAHREIEPIPESLLTPPHEHSPKHMLNVLNDDCLIAIFEQNLLSLNDVQEIAVVCKRFYWIQSVMRSPRRRYADQYLKMERNQPLWRIENFLRENGESVTYADLLKFNSATVCLGMVAKHCPNIQYLATCIQTQAALDEIRPFFGNLRRLFMIMRTTFDMNSVLMSSVETKPALEIWKLITRHHKIILPPINLPKLTTFEWKRNREMHKASLMEFIACNPQLQTVVLNDDGGELISDLQFFLAALPDLQILRFTYSGYHSETDEYFNITRDGDGVHCYAEGRSFTCELLLATLRVLHRMQIPLTQFSTCFNFDEKREVFMEYAQAICKFKTITMLDVQGFNDDEMLLFAQHLGHLQRFFISSNGLTFKGIRNVLETANALTTATFSRYALAEGDEADVIAIDNMVESRNIILHVYGLQRNLEDRGEAYVSNFFSRFFL